MTTSAAVLLAFVAILTTVVPAAAHDHRPPATRLATGESLQDGRLGTYCWTAAAGEPGYYSGICVDAIWTFPPAVSGTAGDEVRIRFESENAPEDLSIRWWPRVENNRYFARPRGTVRSPTFTVEPVVVDGDTIAHEAVFTARSGSGHMYIDVFGHWADREGAGGTQDADWTFHVRIP